MLCAAAGFACDRILFHGTAGGAFGNLPASSGALPFSSTTQVGWTAGAGIEAAISPNWTAKIAIVVATISELPYPARTFSICAATPSFSSPSSLRPNKAAVSADGRGRENTYP